MPKTAQTPWTLVDRPDLMPRCPHCEESLSEVYRKGAGFPLGQGRTLVYFCPHCSSRLCPRSDVLKPGSAYVPAQNNGETGSVDGDVVEEATSSGAFVIATCSGTVPG